MGFQTAEEKYEQSVFFLPEFSTVVHCLALLLTTRSLWVEPPGQLVSSCVEFACGLCTWVVSVLVLRFSPIIQRHCVILIRDSALTLGVMYLPRYMWGSWDGLQLPCNPDLDGRKWSGHIIFQMSSRLIVK